MLKLLEPNNFILPAEPSKKLEFKSWPRTPPKFAKNGQHFMLGEIIYAPPPSPHFWPEGIFQGRGGGGVCFEAPRGRNFIRPPPFIHPPPLEGYFRGGGGWGCINFGPGF